MLLKRWKEGILSSGERLVDVKASGTSVAIAIREMTMHNPCHEHSKPYSHFLFPND